jgi:SAM-dependent methyltransferase
LATTKTADADTLLALMRTLHERWVFQRRARVLASLLSDCIPAGAMVLDVGCGNGVIAHLIRSAKPSVSIKGLEVLPRDSCLIECAEFDGIHIPMPDDSVDFCMFVDVLHHTLNIQSLLEEGRRVARRALLIKDHLCESPFDRSMLRVMDWVGNRAHGVDLPYNYQSRAEWNRLNAACGLRIAHWNPKPPLYPFPFDHVFGRSLHFVGLFERI